MILSLVVAASENNVIGKDGDLPWRLPDDLKYFRRVTEGHPIIMGRKTYESIGRPLPNRLNIVVTRQADLQIDGCEVVQSMDQATALVAEADEVFVIGGGELYRAALEHADRIYMTRVHTEIGGDTFFPDIAADGWQRVSAEEHAADEKHAYAFTFEVYERNA